MPTAVLCVLLCRCAAVVAHFVVVPALLCCCCTCLRRCLPSSLLLSSTSAPCALVMWQSLSSLLLCIRSGCFLLIVGSWLAATWWLLAAVYCVRTCIVVQLCCSDRCNAVQSFLIVVTEGFNASAVCTTGVAAGVILTVSAPFAHCPSVLVCVAVVAVIAATASSLLFVYCCMSLGCC